MTQTRLWEMHWAPCQSRSPRCARPAVAVVSSDFVLADISVKSPRKLYTLIKQHDSSRIKVSKTCTIFFWKQNHRRTVLDYLEIFLGQLDLVIIINMTKGYIHM